MLTPSRRGLSCTPEWHEAAQRTREALKNGRAWRGVTLALCSVAIRIGSSLTSKDGVMEGLRWWLLLLTAIMFSMSG
jgi:hypothetical protein